MGTKINAHCFQWDTVLEASALDKGYWQLCRRIKAGTARWDQQVCKLSRNDKTVGKYILESANDGAVQLSHAFLLIRGERPHTGCLVYV